MEGQEGTLIERHHEGRRAEHQVRCGNHCCIGSRACHWWIFTAEERYVEGEAQEFHKILARIVNTVRTRQTLI